MSSRASSSASSGCVLQLPQRSRSAPSCRLTIIAAWSRCAPPERLGDDLVDQPQLLQARGGDAQRLGGFRRVLRAIFHRIDAQPSGEITE